VGEVNGVVVEGDQAGAGQSFQDQGGIPVGGCGQFGAESGATGVLGSFTGG
jgi:hypothetical protein